MFFGGTHEAAEGDVVASAFDEDGAEFDIQNGVEEWDVFFHQLFLEGDGIGGDDDAFVVFDDAFDGGEEVGEGFADTGACLGDKRTVVFEGGVDSVGHIDLLWADFEAVSHAASDWAIFTKNVINID